MIFISLCPVKHELFPILWVSVKRALHLLRDMGLCLGKLVAFDGNCIIVPIFRNGVIWENTSIKIYFGNMDLTINHPENIFPKRENIFKNTPFLEMVFRCSKEWHSRFFTIWFLLIYYRVMT